VEWVVTTARTIEEARETALDQLGVHEDEAEIEVLQEPQKGLFGRVRAEAKVRARVRPTTPRPKVDRRDRRRRDRRDNRDGDRGAKSRGRGNGGGGGARRTGAEREQQPSPSTGGQAVATVEATTDRESDDRQARSSSSKRRRRRRGSGRTQQGDSVSEPSTSDAAPGATLDIEAQRETVERFLTELMVKFGRSDATVAVTTVEDDTIEATIDGPELGLLVGQKGVTLQALQELVRSVVQRRFVGQSHARIRVDVAGYRARRKAALERFTRDVAQSVLESGTAKALEPMSSADRKVVHDVVNEIDGDESISEGDDPHRRVVIRPV